MEESIRIARLLSARLTRFYEARRIVGKLIYVTMSNEPEIVTGLKKTSQDMDLRILQLEHEVKSSIESLPGFNQKIHQAPVFISQVDIDEGIIDISKPMDKSTLLDVTNGIITIGSKSTDKK
jgi:hypothetical protein